MPTSSLRSLDGANRRRRFRWQVATVVAGLVATAAAGPPSLGAEAPAAAFLAENDAAMARMHRDMHVTPTGDVDRDFVAMMIPHHQGAIDMARAVLRYGQNEQIRRLAQEIIVEQQQEIALMRLALPGAVVRSGATGRR